MSDNFLPADIANASHLAMLHAQCFADAWTGASMTALLASPGVFGFMSSDSFIVLRTAADECEILTLGTAPSLRRQGLARQLLALGAQEAHIRAARTMFLEVADTNQAALALYSTAGFTVVGRRPAYYRGKDGQAANALIFRAPLPLAAK